MSGLDWGVIIAYLAFILGLGWWLGREQESAEDYYLASGGIKWWQSGLSTMATQLGAASFISAPAFVAIKQNGGMRWLTYELGVPIGMLIVMAVIIPVFFRMKVTSIYEYLETRFDDSTRTLVSFLFQLGRGLGTAVAVLLGGITLSTALGISVNLSILVVGIVTIIYDMLGGIKGVIISDVIQMGVIVFGIFLCCFYAADIVGIDAVVGKLSTERATVLDFSALGLEKGSNYGVFPMLFGGIFLYASYYGCDQSQVQRELCVGSVKEVRKALFLNAVGRFPLVLTYCFRGLFIGAVAATPEFADKVAAFTGQSTSESMQLVAKEPDRLVPLFILNYLPHGLIGLLFVAILSALMSSLDSALNSLSAVTLKDFYQKYYKPNESPEHYIKVSKYLTAAWGVFCVGGALIFANAGNSAQDTTIVLINLVGSLLYGPILAVFLLGILTTWATGFAVRVGLIVGVVSNLALWKFTDVSWMWWNMTGFLFSFLAAYLAKGPKGSGEAETMDGWQPIYSIVVGWFVALFGLCYGLQSWLSAA